MAILRAAATASFTLDNTGAPTLIDGLTLTPAADDYQLFATVEVDNFTTGGGDLQEFSVFVGGTLVNSSIRQIQEEASLNIGIITLALNAKVSPNGSQAVEIRFETEFASDASTAERRELTLFPMPAAGTNSEDTDGVDDTLATATWTTLDSMTRTPPADDYLLIFTTDAEGPADVDLGFRVSVGGTHLQHTHRQFANENSLPDTTRPVMIACIVSPNGSEVVEIEWSRVDGAGTITCHARTMSLVPVAVSDFVEATGTADDARTASGEILIDDMTITDPGADDWLVCYSSYILGGTVGTNPVTVMIHEGGAKVTDSDRRNDHDDSEDDTNLPVLAGGRVTIGGATDDLEMFWTLLPGGGGTFTMQERTLVAIREVTAAAGAIAGSVDMVLTPTATIQAQGELAGAVAMALTPTGTLGGGALDIWYKTGQFVTPASGTTVIDVTDKGNGPFAIHVWFSRVTADDTVQADQLFGHGFSDGTNHDTGMTNAQDGADNTNRDGRNANLILIKNPTDDSDDVLAAGAAMNANDVTISYTTFTAGYRIHYEIWGGADGSAEMREVTAASSPIDDLTMVTPDMVLAWTLGQAHPASSIHGYMSFGVAVDNAGIEQWAQFTYMGDNDTDFVGSSLVDGQFAGQYDVDFADWQIQVTAIGSNGVTWAGTNGDEVIFLFLDLAGINVKVDTFAKSVAAAPATQALPDLGFTPMGYALATCNFDLQTLNTDRIVHASMGAYDGVTGHSALAVGTAQSNADRASQSHPSEVLQGSDALQANGVEFSATPQAITDSTPDVEWDPNTTGATDDVVIGLYAFEAQEAAASPIAGTVDLVLTPAGTLTADGELAGAIALAITPAATIQAVGALLGSSDLLLTPAGTLIADGALAGAVALLITPTATLQATGALAGSADMVLTPTATIEALAAILGSLGLVLTPTGEMQARGALVGSSDLVLTPTGELMSRGVLIGSSTLLLTPTGTLFADGELAGSVALLITPTGVIQATGALSGSADLLFTPTGTLASVAPATGSIDLILTPAGTLQARGELTGAAALSITPDGTLQATGALAGSAALLLTPAGTLQALGALLGSSAIVLTPTATLGATGALTGAVALLLTPAGTLVGRGDLLGTAALVFTVTGDAVAAQGAIAGEATLVITATGTMAGLGALAGAASLTLTAAGTLVAEGGILGTSSLTFTLAGDLAALGALAGSADLVLTPAGTLEGLGALTGSLDLAIDPAGILAGIGGLAGSIPLTLDAAGTLLATGALAGGLTMTITPTGTIIATANILGGASLVIDATGNLQSPGELAGTVDLTIDATGEIIGIGALAGSADMVISATGDLQATANIVGSAQLTIDANGTLRAIGELSGLAELAFTLAGIIFDQSARRIPNSLQSLLFFLQNSRQDIETGTDNAILNIEIGELNSIQSLLAGRLNSTQ